MNHSPFYRILFLLLLLDFSLVAAEKTGDVSDKDGWALPTKRVGSGWFVRVAEAREEAKKKDRMILVLFSGPGWSSTCENFESKVVKSKEFQSFVSDRMVCLYLGCFMNEDVPKSQISQTLAFRKAMNPPNFYPCTMVLAADGKTVLGVIEGAPDQKTYLKRLSEISGLK